MKKARRGFILSVSAVMLSGMLFLFALVGDLGRIFLTQSELQNTADSAALAAILEMQAGSNTITEKAEIFGESHWAGGSSVGLAETDIQLGQYGDGGFSPNLEPYDAVRVLARRTQDSPSGPLALLFAPLFGRNFSNVSAHAVAYLDSHVNGVQGGGGLIPYSVSDSLTDSGGNSIFTPGTIVNIFPKSNTPGNFGTLDFDGGSNSTPDTRDWIENGYEDDFVIPPGGALEVDGDPGIGGNSVLSAFQTIIGKTVYLPVFSTVTGEGSNTIYNVNNILAVRVLEVVLTGSQNNRRILVETVRIASSVLITDPAAPEHPGLAKPKLVV